MMTATSQDELEHLPTEYLSFLPHSSQGQLLSVVSTMMLCCVMRFWRTFTEPPPLRKSRISSSRETSTAPKNSFPRRSSSRHE